MSETSIPPGLPLLSAPPPRIDEPNRHGCRRCGKEFGLFTRSRDCQHCGFSYCTSCSDYQALMARHPDDGPGYDVVQVCAYCIEKLTITASGRSKLRTLPVSQLRAYLKAYGISPPANVLEKDDIVQACLAARLPNGCLSPEAEAYYRKHSVPNKSPQPRSLFSRILGAGNPSSNSPSTPPRPNTQTRPASTPRPTHASRPSAAPRASTGPSQYNAPTSNPYRYRPPGQATPPPQPNPNSRPRQAGPRPAAPSTLNASRPSQPATPPRPPSPEVPSIDELLEWDTERIGALSIGLLKGILFANHVPAGQVLEKADLVTKVSRLVDAERRDREREAAIHAEEERMYLERQAEMREEFRRREQERLASVAAATAAATTATSPNPSASTTTSTLDAESAAAVPLPDTADDLLTEGHGEAMDTSDAGSAPRVVSSPPPPAVSTAPAPAPLVPSVGSPPKPSYVAPAVERTGLCVVCQDEEANIVIVDCGHLAMCRNCSELVMNTSRECPLCRTRIVTPQRLLRVFKS